MKKEYASKCPNDAKLIPSVKLTLDASEFQEDVALICNSIDLLKAIREIVCRVVKEGFGDRRNKSLVSISEPAFVAGELVTYLRFKD